MTGTISMFPLLTSSSRFDNVKDWSEYPPGFREWTKTDEGAEICAMFLNKALRISERRPRFSARTIAESIRWDTALRDGTEFKLNNNWIPGLARLFLDCYGNTVPQDFFILRNAIGHDTNRRKK